MARKRRPLTAAGADRAVVAIEFVLNAPNTPDLLSTLELSELLRAHRILLSLWRLVGDGRQ